MELAELKENGDVFQGPVLPAPSILLQIAEANAACNVSEQARTAERDEEEEEMEANEAGMLPEGFVNDCLINGEAGDAALFKALNKKRAACDLSSNLWHVYVGPVWIEDERGQTLSEFFHPLIQNYDEYQRRQVAKIKDKERLKWFNKLVKDKKERLLTHSYRKTIREMAALGQDGLGVRGDGWDEDPYLMACPTGVINLKLGAPRILQPGNPENFLRKLCPTPFRYGGGPPRHLLKALRDIFDFTSPPPDKEQILAERIEDGASQAEALRYYLDQHRRWEDLKGRYTEQMIDFLQLLLGYALIGKVQEHIIIILEGRGRNGKTMLVEVVQYCLGDYASVVQPELLLANPNSASAAAPSPEITDLKGKRPIFASETKEGAHFDTSKVKRLSGGDTLIGRDLYARRPVRFTPTHTLFLMTNNRPNAPADDFAFWKRVILILFMNSFVDNPDPLKPEEKLKNVDLGEQLKEEAPQILAWMIEGSMRYQREGLIIPDFIADSVSEYREEVDTIGQYILDRCLVGSQHSCPANRLYVDYSDWCEVNGYRALSSKNFGLRLKKRFSSARRSSGVIYEGVDLQQDTPLSRRY